MADNYAHADALIETSQVAEQRSNPNVRLVEVDVDTAAYDTGHVPGAVGWNWQTDLQRHPVRDIPTREEWELLLAKAGIGNDTTVVLYGDNNNWFAAFAYWLFRLYGHQNVKLMNGGRKKWQAEGRELTTDVPRHNATTYRAKEPDLSLRALRDQVRQAMGQAALVDVRSPKEYSGELLAPENLPQEGAQRGGHIPGAANIPWASAVRDDGTFKPAEELKSLYGGKGVTADKETIAYCRIGERSAHTWYVLHELLGYSKVRNYDGSWTEWGSLVGAPIERPVLSSSRGVRRLAMNQMRFTVVDGTGTVSFVFDGGALNALLRACAESRPSLDSFLDVAARHDSRLREYVTCGLAVFDEHNAEGNFAAIHEAIRHFSSDEWPVFRVVDESTREASLRPTRTGVIVFNLPERRIVQIQNSYAEILDVAQWVRRLQRAGWRIVP